MTTRNLSTIASRVEWSRLIPVTLQVAFFGIMAALVASGVEG